MATALRGLTADSRLLFATRSIRLFAYGGLSVVLVLYLVSLELTETEVGTPLTLKIVYDLWLFRAFRGVKPPEEAAGVSL